jgi:hypothetical protein
MHFFLRNVVVDKASDQKRIEALAMTVIYVPAF